MPRQPEKTGRSPEEFMAVPGIVYDTFAARVSPRSLTGIAHELA